MAQTKVRMLWWTLKELKADDWRARQTAAETLGELREARAIDPLVLTLKDKNPNVRRAAEEALARIGSSAVPPLVTLFKSADADLRQAAVQVLVRMGQVSVPSLGHALHDPDSVVRDTAAKVLSKINGDESLAQLLAALKAGDAGAKDAAAAALVKLGARAVRPLVEILRENKPRVRETVAAALVRLGERAVGPLIAALKERETREAVIETLTKIEPKWATTDAAKSAIPKLIEELQSDDENARRSAANALGQIGEASALEPLLKLLEDPSDALKEVAATNLGRLGDPRALTALVRVLTTSKPKVRAAAAASLTQIGSALAEPLVIALKSRDTPVREAAAGVLVQVGHAVIEPLAQALLLIDPGLAQQATESSSPQFVAALSEGSPAASRPEPRPLRPREAKANEPQFSFIGASVPAKFAQDLVTLARAYCSPDPAARESAVKSLLQATSSEPLLVKALQDENHGVRRAAAHALANQGDGRAREVLRSDLNDSSGLVALDAAESLLKVGEISVVMTLVRVLRECDRSSNSGSASHDAERATRLLYYLLENRVSEIIDEDLSAVTELQSKSEPKFVSSFSGATGLRASASEPSRGTGAQLSELRAQAQRELNRRKVARR